MRQIHPNVEEKDKSGIDLAISQLDRWLDMKADHPSEDYTKALTDFRNLLQGTGPYDTRR